MNTYLIGYDLNKKGQNYKAITERIETIFSIWWHQLDSTYIVKTNYDCEQIRNKLSKYIDDNDELLVVELSGIGAWQGFDSKGSQWLKDFL